MLAELAKEHIGLILAGVCLGLGMLLSAALRRKDHRTFVLGRAPALPVRALTTHDDAWLWGTLHCEQPLRCPWFEVDCVAYTYDIEVKRTERYRDSKGKMRTRTYWASVHSHSDQVPCELDDGERILLALPEAEIKALTSLETDYETSQRRHSASVLRPGDTVSALGVLREDHSFGPLSKVPLLVTYQTREQCIKSSASAENWLFFFSLLFPCVGVAVASGLLLDARVWPDWLVPAAIGLGFLIPQWWLMTYNRLVRLRQQVLAAEKQVSIELAMRRDLVPNLVAIIKAASGHENELLQDLTSLRTTGNLTAQIEGEEVARQTASQVLVLHEQYPDLKSDALYLDLHGRLWAIEEKIAHARGFWNDTVTEWNDRVQKIPSRLVASLAGMTPRPLFAAGDEVALPPQLELP